jgi:hypothetical protein
LAAKDALVELTGKQFPVERDGAKELLGGARSNQFH